MRPDERLIERVISFSTQTLNDVGMKDVSEVNTGGGGGGGGGIGQTSVWFSTHHLVCRTSAVSFSAPFQPLVSSAEVQSEQHGGADLSC